MPSDSELKNYYSHYHPDEEIPREQTIIDLHDGLVDLLVRDLGSPAAPTFLDYGFGRGFFMKKALERGMTVHGVEFSDENCERMMRYCRKNHLEAKARLTNLCHNPLDTLPREAFDCITLFQVIEHIVEPLRLLASLKPILKPGGLVYLECPNEDAFYLKIKNPLRKKLDRLGFYGSLNPPQHVHGFNRRSMNTLLTRSGFEPIVIRDYPYGDGFHQPETITFYPTVMEWIGNPERWHFYTMGKTAIRVTERWVSKLGGLGGGLFALARKR
jgi:SAM-dependent methyltransferase